MINKLSVFGTIGAISIIGVGILTFTRPVATANVTTEKAYSPLIIQEPTPVVPPVAEPVVEPTAEPVVTAPVVAPVILSADEYAAKYLDLSTTHFQECWTILKQMYPERFTQQLSEKSILKIAPTYKYLCAQRILFNTTSDGVVHKYNSAIGMYGEYFDR